VTRATGDSEIFRKISNENKVIVRRSEVSETVGMTERVIEGRYYVFGGL
jgi:hypothetical protein